ncbi:MAG: hypothetical protein HY791_22595 [Deltaproteobacteria bacterium]|nr:hypothetical protein [Deltaproteobacteria bacterium]
MMDLRTRLFALFLAATSCSKDECVALEKLKAEHQSLLTKVRIQAEKADELEKSSAQFEVETNAMIDRLGFNKSDTELDKVLGERVAKLGGAKLRVIDPPASPQQGPVPRAWTISVLEKTPTAALSRAFELASSPPLIEIKTLVDDGKGVWSVQLERAVLDRLDLKPQPAKVVLPVGPETIKRTISMCGAGALRAAITKMREELEAKAPRAELMTELVQKRTTVLGQKRRAELLSERERETRSLQNMLVEAAEKAGVPIKAVGFEEPMVILEIRGTAAHRAKVEAKLPKELESVIGRPEGGAAGIVRLSLPNEVSRTPRNRVIGTKLRALPSKKEDSSP